MQRRYVVVVFVAALTCLLSASVIDDNFLYEKMLKYGDLYFKKPESDEFVCEQYLAPSKWLSGGIGVFAGRKYNIDEKMVPGVSLVFPISKLGEMQLRTYVFSGLPTMTDMVAAEFGPAMLYNHHDRNNLKHHYMDNWTGDDEHVSMVVLPQLATFQKFYAHSVYPVCSFSLIEDVQPGEELFNEYGGEPWFTGLGIEMLSPERNQSSYESLEELEKVGYCLSNVYVDRSTIHGAGKGVFASRDIKSGEVIEVSPVLAIAANDAIHLSGVSSVLLNYCFAHTNLSIALMPIGTVGAINHGGALANVVYDLHFWGGDHTAENVLFKSPESLLESKFADLFFKYNASRDIAKGEELMIDYGASWESAWRAHGEKLEQFSMFEAPLPLFRHHIELRDGLFPSHWFADPFEEVESTKTDLTGPSAEEKEAEEVAVQQEPEL